MRAQGRANTWKMKRDRENKKPFVSARGKKKKRLGLRKTQNKLQDPKQNISNKKGFCFAPSQSIVLFAKGENVNLLWKEELGGFVLSILISGNSLILGGGAGCNGLGEKAAYRMNTKVGENIRRVCILNTLQVPYESLIQGLMVREGREEEWRIQRVESLRRLPNPLYHNAHDKYRPPRIKPDLQQLQCHR